MGFGFPNCRHVNRTPPGGSRSWREILSFSATFPGSSPGMEEISTGLPQDARGASVGSGPGGPTGPAGQTVVAIRRDDRYESAVQQDHRGDSGRRVGAPFSSPWRRRALAWGALGTVALIGLGAAAAGTASGAQAVDLRASPPAGTAILTPMDWALGADVTRIPRPTPRHPAPR